MSLPMIALISGANQGTGRAVAESLAVDHGYHVLVGSRNLAAGEVVAESLTSRGFLAEAIQLDLTSDYSISTAVSYITRKYNRLDVLVNNGGILIDVDVKTFAPSTLPIRDLLYQTFNTNVFGSATLIEACLPLLKMVEAPRMVFVGSNMGSLKLAGDTSQPFYESDFKAYDSSKAALHMLALNYARLLKDVGGMVNIACPGTVSTSLTGFIAGGDTPEAGAVRVVELATLKKGGPTGTFSNKNGTLPW